MSFLIHHFLDYHAECHPDTQAVSCLEDHLTYRQLQTKANQLANRLIEVGVKPNDRVGIYMNKCLDMSVAIYGILKAGAAYVPIDPNAPVKRAATIIEDCAIKLVISHNPKVKRLKKIIPSASQTFDVIGIDSELLAQDVSTSNKLIQPWSWVFENTNTSSPQVDVIESDLAYIIYTSGSTGKPKGIMHTHHSCLSYVNWAVQTVDVTPNDRLGNHCPLHFDISIFDWFAAAVAGACVIVIPDEYTKLPASYAQLIASSQMTVLFTVPFALIQLAQYGEVDKHDMSKLRWITFAGEPMVIKHLHTMMQLLPHVTFDNMFGPAETNVCAHYIVTNVDANTSVIPIGKMCNIAQSLIVDEQDKPVNDGETGELLVRTPTMMCGYWASPALNSQAFYKLDAEITKTYYRTGDLVKIDASGQMWFVGRKDRQVKIRGYRVELDEIEAVLVSHSSVEEAAVYPISTSVSAQLNSTNTAQDTSTSLHASYTCKSDDRCHSDDINKELLKFLKANLPSYAIPSTLTKVHAFPRTSSEKIDRNQIIKEASHVSTE
jgi:amino acid adenylation domain-containing protein